MRYNKAPQTRGFVTGLKIAFLDKYFMCFDHVCFMS